MRKVCSSVRQDSPGKVERRELMLCVATMGMHLCLAREGKELLISTGVVFAHRSEGVVFVAEKEQFAPRAIGVLHHPGNAVQNSASSHGT